MKHGFCLWDFVSLCLCLCFLVFVFVFVFVLFVFVTVRLCVCVCVFISVYVCVCVCLFMFVLCVSHWHCLYACWLLVLHPLGASQTISNPYYPRTWLLNPNHYSEWSLRKSEGPRRKSQETPGEAPNRSTNLWNVLLLFLSHGDLRLSCFRFHDRFFPGNGIYLYYGKFRSPFGHNVMSCKM